MSMMKRLIEEESDIFEADWRVLPVVEQASERRHRVDGTQHRLMEHIGKGRWIERKRGAFKEMTALCNQYNKENYHTPKSKDEVSEVKRFSLMERARVTLQ